MIDPLAICRMCEYHRRTSLFELCLHAQSEYKVADEPASHHTIGHMRSRGACGHDAVLFEKRTNDT